MTPEEKQQIIEGYQLPQGALDNDDLADNAHTLVYYESKAAQLKRFEVLCLIAKRVGVPFEGKSILDVGCGLGNLYDYLSLTVNHFDYLGVDITSSLIKGAHKLHPGVAFREMDILLDPVEQHDYVIASGIFNDRIADNEAHLRTMISKMLEIARYGVTFNFLVELSVVRYRFEQIRHKLSRNREIEIDTPEELFEDDLYFYKKRELLNYFKKQPGIAGAFLTSGYIPGDATMQLIKVST